MIDRRRFLNDAGTLGLIAMAFPDDALSQETAANPQRELTFMDNPFNQSSTFENPRLEFVFEIELTFTRVHNINNTPAGSGRGAVYIDSGVVRGPQLNGIVVPNSGGDWAQFRPDDVLATDARYMLEADDGTLILIRNNGYLWGKYPDTMTKIREWIFENGPEVPETDYYLRAHPTFEVEQGKYDWLMRHVVIGIGRRKQAGNTIRYYALL